MFKNPKSFVIPLQKKWNILNYENFLDKSNLVLLSNQNKLFVDFNKNLINDAFLEAFFNYDNLNGYVCFHKDKTYAYSIFTKYFSINFILYGIKQIKLDWKQLFPFLYQCLFDEEKTYELNEIQEIIKFLKKEKKYAGKYIVNFLIFKEKKKIDDQEKLDLLHNTSKSLNNLIIYCKNKKQKCTISSLFFNQNSLDFLNLMNFNKFMSFSKINNTFFEYRDFMYNEINTKDHYRFMLYSSIILYLLGSRENNDLDIYVDKLDKSDTYNIYSKIKTQFIDNNTSENKLFDVSIKNTKYWPVYWDTWLDQWASLCKARKFKNILSNSKFHFFFLGIKIIHFKCDIERRKKRQRPRAYADLLMLKRFFNINFKMPKIPNFKTLYKKTLTQTELNSNLWIYDKKNKEYYCQEIVNKKRFLDIIRWFIKTKYKQTISINELTRIFKVKIMNEEELRKKELLKNMKDCLIKNN